MKTTIKAISLAVLTATILFSCKKGDTGGDATIAGHVKHHSTPIKGATVYVKFDEQELPSDPTNNYDLKIVGEANEDHVHIEGLRYGKYYLYAVGFDSTIMQTVTGGVPVKIKWSERKEEIETDIAVTE
jgi:hypothetical protein